MKSLVTLLCVGLVAACLTGCATTGKAYDDSKIAQIKRNQTTESQLLEWFGPAESRSLGPDGRMALTWSFGRKTAAGSKDSGTLQVKLDPDGKVDLYSAHRGPG